MNNGTKWLIALPFVFLVAFALPAAVAGDWLWFVGDWAAMLFVGLTVGMWLAATAFVDASRARGPRDRATSTTLTAAAPGDSSPISIRAALTYLLLTQADGARLSSLGMACFVSWPVCRASLASHSPRVPKLR